MDLNEFEKNVIKWATERGIYSDSTSKDQFIKLSEEFGELASAILTGNKEGIMDGIGDMMVVLVNIAHTENETLGQCARFAWDEIKNRNGEMINGTFVKEEE